MFAYRKSSFIVEAFLVVWVVTSISYSMGTQCVCSSHNQNHSKHHRNTHHEKCCSPLDDLSNNCTCECVACGKSNENDIASQKKFIPSFDKDELSGLNQLSPEVFSSLSDTRETNYQYSTFPLKFLSLYLIKASFLL